MSSVIIKGVKEPKNCEYCAFCKSFFGRYLCFATGLNDNNFEVVSDLKNKPDWCPMKEINDTDVRHAAELIKEWCEQTDCKDCPFTYRDCFGNTEGCVFEDKPMDWDCDVDDCRCRNCAENKNGNCRKIGFGYPVNDNGWCKKWMPKEKLKSINKEMQEVANKDAFYGETLND